MQRKMKKKYCVLSIIIFSICVISTFCYAEIQISNKDSYIKVNGDLLSLNIKNMPLIDVLLSIQSKTGIDIKVMETIKDRVSINFSDFLLEQGLKRLLRHVGYAMIWEGENDNSTLKVLWIVRKGEGFKNKGALYTNSINSSMDGFKRKAIKKSPQKITTRTQRNVNSAELIGKDTQNERKNIQQRTKAYHYIHDQSQNMDNSSTIEDNISSNYVEKNNDVVSQNYNEDNLPNNVNSYTSLVNLGMGNNVGAFEFRIDYDPKLIQITNVKLGPYLSDTGRNVSILGPKIDNKKGNASFGSFSFGSGEGANGEGVLAVINYSSSSNENVFKLNKVRITDTNGNILNLSPKIQKADNQR